MVDVRFPVGVVCPRLSEAPLEYLAGSVLHSRRSYRIVLYCIVMYRVDKIRKDEDETQRDGMMGMR